MEKIENKRIIQSYYSKITINIILLIIFLVVIFSVITPGYSEYKTNKNTLLTNIKNYDDLQKNGLNFGDFSSSITDDNLKNLVSKIGADFYGNNLKNTSGKTYIDFLKEKENEINELGKSDTLKLRDKKISKVLPSYQEGNSIDGSMSDLEFINYIEVILRSFKLKTNSKIGINDLMMVESKNTDSLSSQIFYIPIKLDLEGAKGDIVDFLYFIQNVGKIESIKENDIIFYKDKILNKNLINFSSSNIYENKIVDIESIDFQEYIDTSSFIRNTSGQTTTEGFLYFIRNGTEKDQAYKININLRFYVKGLPIYKIEKYINDIINSYKENLKLTTDNIKNIQSKKLYNNSNNVINIISKLKSIETYLLSLEQDIKKLESGVKSKTNLERLYTEAAKIKYNIENIKSVLNKNIDSLNNKK